MNLGEFEDFEPYDFLKVACELSENFSQFESSPSSIKRTIFSRTYYAIFLFVREWLSENTNYVSNPLGEHKRMPNYIKFKGPFDKKTNWKLFNDINTLKKLRHQSDYYLNVPPVGTKEYDDWIFEDVDFAIELANNVIGNFTNYFKNS